MKTKMKLLSVLMLSMGLVLGACSNEATDNDDPDGPDLPETTEYGYFSLDFMDTGSLPSKGDVLVTDPGTDDESKISKLRVILYNTSTGAIEYAFAYDITTGTPNYTGSITEGQTMTSYTSGGIIPTATSSATLKTEAEFVKLQPYNMVVLVNPTDKIKGFTTKGSGDTYSVFLNRKVEDLGFSGTDPLKGYQALTGSNNPENEFFMTNFQEAIEVPASALKGTKAAAELNPVIAYVERAVAKVTFTTPKDSETDVTDITVPEGATISNLAWRLDITNKNSYLMRHITFDNSGTTMESTNSAWSVPNRHKFYAKDVNMTDVSYERYAYNGTLPAPGSITPGYPKTFFNYITNTDVTNKFATGYEYALENSMDAEEQYEDVTTAAIVKLKYNPGVSAIGTAIALDASYYVWTTNADGVVPTKYVFTAADLNIIKALPDDSTYPEFAALRTWLNTNETVLEALFGTGYTYSGPTSLQSTILNGMRLAYHIPADNYYRVLIRHYDDVLQPTPMAWGRYGVVRNNVYKLTLTSVKGPGDIDIPDPKGPDDKYGYLAVHIEILPWTVRTQNADI